MPVQIVRQLSNSPYAFPLLALLALALLFISETSHRRALNSLNALDQTSELRAGNQRLLRLVIDAETGQRGYLLTGRAEYLEPYRTAITELRALMADLEQRYKGHATQQPVFSELALQINRKLSEMQASLTMFQDGNPNGALELLLTDIGREQMDSVRKASLELVGFEVDKIAVQRAEINRTLTLGRIGIGAMTALSLLALLLYLRQNVTMTEMREERRRVLETERDQLEALAKERTEQLAELARHLQTAREDERSRLARDLHDELGALLTAAKLDVARLKSRLPDISPEAASRLLHLNETLNSGIALKRRIIEDLRPSSLSNLGLVAALDIQAREFAEASGLKVTPTLQAVSLAASAELTVYRLVQEAMTNIAKYAKATEVKIVLGPHPKGAEISVSDDGIGFDADAARRTSAHGLLGMRFRVEAEGGRMEIDSTPGMGTCISATLPLHPPAVAGVDTAVAAQPVSAPDIPARKP
jgi:signal transduction histidine kinase